MACPTCSQCGAFLRPDGTAMVTRKTLSEGGKTTWKRHPDMANRMNAARAQSKVIRADVRKLKAHVYE